VVSLPAGLLRSWRFIALQRFWLLVGLAMLAGVVGHAFSRGWGSQAGNLLATRWPWLLIGISAAAVVLRLAWWLWWELPKQQANGLGLLNKERAEVEDNYRKTIGQLLGAAVVLIGAGAAYVQFTQQQQAAHDLLISNQVSKGFELLGNKDGQIEQRLGGIYALEGVMSGSTQYHQPVLEALCAFIRGATRAKTNFAAPATEIQAALTVIGRRGPGSGKVNLVDAHIPQADLSDAHLEYAILNGAHLEYAILNGAHLEQADLSDAHLEQADLGNAHLEYASLIGAKGLTQDQLDTACGGENTKLDPKLKIKPCPWDPPAAGWK
jgi:uncharacterized protein YjbI with pentapeptide repeats